jgi:hypothetical protein
MKDSKKSWKSFDSSDRLSILVLTSCLITLAVIVLLRWS